MRMKKKTKGDISHEILKSLIEIREKYPELYRNIDEIPLVDTKFKKGVGKLELQKYLTTLQAKLKRIKNRPNQPPL